MKNQNLSGFYRAIAKVICYLPNIEQKEIMKTLRLFIAHEAKIMYPGASISNLAQKTGISRGVISELLKKNTPTNFVNKDSVVLAELWKNKNENNKIPIKGEFSFYSIAKNILNSSYKPESCLNSLIMCNAVEFCKEDLLLIKTNKLELHNDSLKLNHLVNKIFERYIDTLLYNFNVTNEEKLFDQTHSTTKTTPKKIKATHKEIKEYLNNVAFKKIQEIIDSNESDVEPGSYPVYSLSIFEFLGGKINSN